MFDVFPVRKFIKVHCLFVWSPVKGISVAKLSPILNQMGVFDSHIADTVLEKFSSKLKEHFEKRASIDKLKASTPLRFSFGVVLYLLKRKKTKSMIFILGPDFADLLKRFFNTSLFVHRNFKMKYLSAMPIHMSKLEFIKLLLFHLCFFRFENFSFFEFIHKSHIIKSILLSYRFRWKMKFRKTNFKRKRGRGR
jgi:hypothetical protein